MRLPDTQSAADYPANFTLSRTEATAFDRRGRVIQETSPEGTLSYNYDALGRMTHTAINADPPVVDLVKDPYSYLPSDPSTAERVTSYGHDILGRLVSVTEDATPDILTDDPQVQTDYSFDLQGRQSSMHTGTTHTVPSILTVMQYDSLGRLDIMSDYRVATDGSETLTASYDYEVRADGRRTASTAEEKKGQEPEEKKGQEPNWQIRQFVYLPICPYMLLTLFLAQIVQASILERDIG